MVVLYAGLDRYDWRINVPGYIMKQVKIQCPGCKTVYDKSEDEDIITCQKCNRKLYCFQVDEGKNIIELELQPGKKTRIIIEKKKVQSHSLDGGPPRSRRV